MGKTNNSWIWNYLTKRGPNKAACNFCYKEFTTGKGTSSIIYYLNHLHQEKIAQNKPTTPSTKRALDEDDKETVQPPNKMLRSIQTTLQSSKKRDLKTTIAHLAAEDGFTFNQIAKSDIDIVRLINSHVI